MNTAFESADFYILFSRSETFGLSYLEAMSQGLPVISLDLLELKKLMPIGNILATSPQIAASSFLTLLKPEIYDDISKKNIRRAQQYSYEIKMAELESVYLELKESEG